MDKTFENDNLGQLINQWLEKRRSLYDKLLMSVNLSNEEDDVLRSEYNAIGLNTLSDCMAILIEDDISRALELNIRDCNLSKNGAENIIELIEEKFNISIDIDKIPYPSIDRLFELIKIQLNKESDINITTKQRIANFASWFVDCLPKMEEINYIDVFTNYSHHEPCNQFTFTLLLDLLDLSGKNYECPAFYECIKQDLELKINSLLQTFRPTEIALLKCYYKYKLDISTIAENIISAMNFSEKCHVSIVKTNGFNVSPENNNDDYIESITNIMSKELSKELEKVMKKCIRKLRHPSRSKYLRGFFSAIDNSSELFKALTLLYNKNPQFTLADYQKSYYYGEFKHLDVEELGLETKRLFKTIGEPTSIESEKLLCSDHDTIFSLVTETATKFIEWYPMPKLSNIPYVIYSSFASGYTVQREDVFCTAWDELEGAYLIYKIKSSCGAYYYRLFQITARSFDTNDNESNFSFNNLRYIRQIPLEEDILSYLHYIISTIHSSYAAFNDLALVVMKEIYKYELYNELEYYDQKYIIERISHIDELIRKSNICDYLGKFDPLNRTIETANFSVRTFNCLKRAGINTIYDITQLSEDNLMKIRNLGSRSIEEIKDFLKKHKLSLSNEQ